MLRAYRPAVAPLLCAWALLVLAPACAKGGGAFDAGLTDLGQRDECGAAGDICCPLSPRCDDTVCGVDGTCCAVVGIGGCAEDDDCCGDLECVGGGCCVTSGQPCGSAIDCCNNGLCLAGICIDESELCGAERDVCCEGGACRAGLECSRDTCVPCGGVGEPCCRTGDACEGMGACIEGTCGLTPVECGDLGQPCCETIICNGGLSCEGGSCAEPEDLCDFSDCESCAAAVSRGCGFCEDTSDCTSGTADGPATGTCSAWRFGATSCPRPDPCPDINVCGDCTAEMGCGWCDSQRRCVAGTSAGPTEGTCPDWRWTVAACEPDSCRTNTSCRSCTLDFSFVCGWCGDVGGCRRGTSGGPVDASCDEADWSWLSSDCP